MLDVGCGGGYTCEFLAQRGAQVTGIDPSGPCITAARRHAAAMDLAIDYHQGRGEQLPFPAASFDVVVCVDVLEHVDNPAQTVAAIARVLKPGGWFCFDTINRTWQSRLLLIWLLEDWLRQIPRGVHDWRKFLPPQELGQFCQAAGLVDLQMHGFDLLGRTPPQQLGNLRHFWRTGDFRVRFDQDLRVMYIGTARLGG